MCLFNYDVLNNKVSKYETNHIHMIISENIEGPIYELDEKRYGTFIHEYVHYVQHFTTHFGVKICAMYNLMFYRYITYLKENEVINLPLELWKEDADIKSFIESFNKVKGSKDCEKNVDELEILHNEIEISRSERSAVKIGVYDFENNEAQEDGFYFGYICIIESMAHLIQSLFNENLNHPIIPYSSVELVFKSYYKEKESDKKLMISLCLCSLMFPNPGVAFFDMIDYSKKHPNLSGYQLYKKLLQDHPIRYNDKEMPISRALCVFLDELENQISLAINKELKYYSKIIKNCQREISECSNTLLDLIYEDIYKDRKKTYEVLVDRYGYPFIEAQNIIIMPNEKSDDGFQLFLETKLMLGLELLYKRIKSSKLFTTCGWYHNCDKNKYTEEDITSQECLYDQWEKKEDCLFVEILKFYGIRDKQYVQRN